MLGPVTSYFNQLAALNCPEHHESCRERRWQEDNNVKITKEQLLVLTLRILNIIISQ